MYIHKVCRSPVCVFFVKSYHILWIYWFLFSIHTCSIGLYTIQQPWPTLEWSPTRPSAHHGPSCLTSVILRELVFPTWYYSPEPYNIIRFPNNTKQFKNVVSVVQEEPGQPGLRQRGLRLEPEPLHRWGLLLKDFTNIWCQIKHRTSRNSESLKKKCCKIF